MQEKKIKVTIPNILISTPGSREGICGSSGKTSSSTYHLSMYSSNLPRHTRQPTRTWNEKKTTTDKRKHFLKNIIQIKRLKKKIFFL